MSIESFTPTYKKLFSLNDNVRIGLLEYLISGDATGGHILAGFNNEDLSAEIGDYAYLKGIGFMATDITASQNLAIHTNPSGANPVKYWTYENYISIPLNLIMNGALYALPIEYRLLDKPILIDRYVDNTTNASAIYGVNTNSKSYYFKFLIIITNHILTKEENDNVFF